MILPQTIEIKCMCGRKINVTLVENSKGGEQPIMTEQTSRYTLRGECSDGK